MANEKRLICAYVLAEKVHESKHQNPHDDPKVARNHMFEHDHFLKMICLSPTVDAVEVVHGRWEPRKDVIGFVRCSVCHDCNIYDDWADGKKWNYCPNCGAMMDGKETT